MAKDSPAPERAWPFRLLYASVLAGTATLFLAVPPHQIHAPFVAMRDEAFQPHAMQLRSIRQSGFDD